MKHRPVITEKQEEMLSYLVGMAPVGQPFQVRHKWITQDFNWMDHSNFCQTVRRLMAEGCVERLTAGSACEPSWYRVLKRPEDCVIAGAFDIGRLRREQRAAA